MTLLITEIHPHNEPDKAFIVFAADRRISDANGRKPDQKKIFPLPALNAGIGYFGIAYVLTAGVCQPMADWLQKFIRSTTSKDTLGEVASRLADALNTAVPKEWRTSIPSGISGVHLAGFNADGQPEFRYVRNVDDRDPANVTLLPAYEACEDFQRRDAPRLSPGIGQVYRHGDLRAHVTAWEKIDEGFGWLLSAPNFRGLRTPADYADWTRFKMELTAQFYKKFCTVSIIGPPVDAFPVTWRRR